MDGRFAPQLSFGEAYTREISKASKIPLDIHLMVSEPEKEVPKYFEFRPRILFLPYRGNTCPCTSPPKHTFGEYTCRP